MAALVFSFPYLVKEGELHLGGAKIAPDRRHYASADGSSTILIDRLPCGVIFDRAQAVPAPGTIAGFGWKDDRTLWVRLNGTTLKRPLREEASGLAIEWASER